jgi:hypothetical protein
MARRKLARTFQICANAADAKAVRPPWRMMRYRRSAAVISVARTTVVCSLFAGGRLCFGGSCLLLRCWPPGAHHHQQQQCATCIALSESADVAIRHKIHFLIYFACFSCCLLGFFIMHIMHWYSCTVGASYRTTVFHIHTAGCWCTSYYR